MWEAFLRKVKLVVTDETLRTRVLFVLAALVVFRLLAAIPENRLEDVIYFNPIDTDFPIGFNILEVKNPDHKHLVSSADFHRFPS